MAQAVKNYYVSVMDVNHKTVVTKMFFNVKDANKFLAEMKEKYPKPFTCIREFY